MATSFLNVVEMLKQTQEATGIHLRDIFKKFHREAEGPTRWK